MNVDVNRVGQFDMLAWAMSGETKFIGAVDPDLIEDRPNPSTYGTVVDMKPYRKPEEVKYLFGVKCRELTKSGLDHVYKCITVTVSPRLWPARLDDEQRHFLEVIFKMNTDDYMLIPAVSENEYLHWHGIFKCNNRERMRKLERKLRMAMGFCAIRRLHEHEKWEEYVFDPHQRTIELEGSGGWVKYAVLGCGRRQPY